MTPPRKPRQRRTPAERAQEAVGVLQRRYDKLTARLVELRREVETTTEEQAEALARLDYAQQNPDLPDSGVETIDGDNPTEEN